MGAHARATVSRAGAPGAATCAGASRRKLEEQESFTCITSMLMRALRVKLAAGAGAGRTGRPGHFVTEAFHHSRARAAAELQDAHHVG
jgi:hypothetical protein